LQLNALHPNRSATSAKAAAWKAVFDHFDKDGGGKISTNELVMSGLVDSRQQGK
jgi:Ca2+-binding EF-hand superfamily protein